MSLANALYRICDDRGIPQARIPGGDFEVHAKAGGPPFIYRWNEAVLGPRPTAREIDTATATVSSERTATQYQRDREVAYNSRGSTINDMVVALWERQVEGRTESADAIEIIRQQVKAENPKP